MTDVEVVGLSPDGTALLLRVSGEKVEVPLEEVHRAERRARRQSVSAEDLDAPLTPKLVQQRIRCGESAEEVAAAGGWPVAQVRRYEGPPLAEREHHAAAARLSETDGRIVEELVAGHLRAATEDLVWDSWLVEDGRWEVQASASGQAVRLRWDPATRRVHAVDEPARRALRVAGLHDDVLTAVLRPVSTGESAAPSPLRPARTGRRAEVPGWGDIASQVTGRDRAPED